MIICAMSLALVAGVALAAEQAVAPAAKAASCTKGKKAEKSMTCKGVIDSVDAAGGKLAVKNAKAEVVTFTISADVKISINGKKAALADLVAGQDVAVKYCGAAESMVVKSVSVKVPKAKKAKAAAK
jgi:hypothetical protein